MKKIYLFTLCALLLNTSVFGALALHYDHKANETTDNRAEAFAASWAAYCTAYDVNPETPTDEQINFYLDAWRGSVDEENALTTDQNNAIN